MSEKSKDILDKIKEEIDQVTLEKLYDEVQKMQRQMYGMEDLLRLMFDYVRVATEKGNSVRDPYDGRPVNPMDDWYRHNTDPIQQVNEFQKKIKKILDENQKKQTPYWARPPGS